MRHFKTIPTREAAYIAGLSMGGLRRAQTGVKEPAFVSRAVSHSGAYEFASRAYYNRKHLNGSTSVHPDSGSEPRGGMTIFTPSPKVHKRNAQSRTLRPAHRLRNRRFSDRRKPSLRALLQKLDLSHEYEEHSGGHTWNTGTNNQGNIAFFARELSCDKTLTGQKLT
jgi:enterochelin esterase-like enzyme